MDIQNVELNGAKRIVPECFGLFEKTLRSKPIGEDTFLSSPGYFYHTGRDGLWFVENGSGDWCVICLHPNVHNSMLVFPSPGELDLDFIIPVCRQVWQDTKSPVTLCRVSNRHLRLVEDSDSFEHVEERVLDWRYPCVVFSAARILAQEGSAFAKFRQNIRKIDPERSEVINPIGRTEVSSCRSLFDSWACSVARQKNFSFANLMSPNMSGLNLSLDPSANVQACLVLYDGNPIGFFSYQSLPGSDEICCISMCSDRLVPGASEYTYFVFAQVVADLGLAYFNLNGSETNSLDRFRNKLHPWRRYQVHSFAFVPGH